MPCINILRATQGQVVTTVDIEQFYIEKQDNFVKFLEALKTEYAPEQFQHIRHSTLDNFANLDFTSFQSYQVSRQQLLLVA